jgi:hypothetical protein
MWPRLTILAAELYGAVTLFSYTAHESWARTKKNGGKRSLTLPVVSRVPNPNFALEQTSARENGSGRRPIVLAAFFRFLAVALESI